MRNLLLVTILIFYFQLGYAQTTTTHYDFTYPDRISLLGDGWDFMAGYRNTEQTVQTGGAVVSYDQLVHPGVLRIPVDEGILELQNTRNTLFRDLPSGWTSVRLKISSFTPVQNYQQVGLFVYENDYKYVSISRAFNLKDVISFLYKAWGDPTEYSIEDSITHNLYFRLDRNLETETITSYFSQDGITWTSVGSVDQFMNNPRLAIVTGGSPEGLPNSDIAWAEIFYQPPILNELRAFPNTLVFNSVQGNPQSNTQSINIFSTLGENINWIQTTNDSWLTPYSQNGVTEAVLKVGVKTDGLASGRYLGHITLVSPQSNAEPIIVPVTLIINPDVPVKITTWKDGFDAAMSVSVDDGQRSGFDSLQKYGLKGTYTYNGTIPPGYYTDLYNAGMELGSHTVNHPCDLLPDNILRNREIQPNILGICANTPQPCKDVISLVWPCGATSYREQMVASDYFLSARGYNFNKLEDATPDNFMNLKNYNSHEHPPFPPSDLKTVVDTAIVQRKWFNLVLHAYTNDDGAIAYAKTKNIWVAPIGTVIKYILQRDRIILSDYNLNSDNLLFNASRLAIPSSLYMNFEDAFGPNDSTTLQIDIDDDISIDNVKINGTNNPFQLKEIDGNKVLLTNVKLEPNITKLIQINFSPCDPSVNISVSASANPVCTGANVDFTATPTNGGTQPAYQWKVNDINTGVNSTTFSYIPANNDIVACVLTSNANCATGGLATSNPVNMAVNPLLPASVTVSASATTVCAGTTVNFTATPVNGGTLPVYQWKVNNVNAGSNSATFSYTPANNDNVTCVLTSTATCVIDNPATSSPVTMIVNPLLPVSVSVAPSDNPVCASTLVTFTATPVNGGSTPAYQWKKNGTNVGTNSPTYAFTPANNDIITCVLTSNVTCSTGNPATSNPVNMTVNPLPAAVAGTDIDICAGTGTTLGAAAAVGNTYSWTSDPSGFTSFASNPIVSPAVTITYTLVETITATGCTNTHNVTVTVNPLPAAVAGSNVTICAGAGTTIGAAAVVGNTYSWTSNPTGFTSFASNPVVSPAVTTTYTLVETITATGCTNTHNLTVTMNPVPAAAGSIAGSTTLAPGTTGVAYSVGVIANASSYTWNYSGTGVNINGITNSVTLDFAANVTDGQLSVYGTNTCGNGIASTLDISSNKTLGLTVYLEGPYNTVSDQMNTTLNTNTLIPLQQPYSGVPWNYAGTESVASIPSGVVDWVLVELRDAATPAAAIPSSKLAGWTKAYFIKADGSIVDLDGTSPPNIGNPTVVNNLYVIIRHRNHIAVLSANGMTLAGNNYNYNFSSGINQAYGGEAGYKQIGTGVFGMVSGDADEDVNISVLDYSKWAADFGLTSTYITSDVDMDGEVSVLDYSKWATNFGMANIILLQKAASGEPVHSYRSQIPGDN